jgi:hypothetical protein
LPIVPDEDVGPYGALNPFRIWWMVVLIAGVSFAGYLAMRLFGARLAGFLATPRACSIDVPGNAKRASLRMSICNPNVLGALKREGPTRPLAFHNMRLLSRIE